MTEKKENILKAALELFAREGYHAVSTSKVAKKAGVSEALIFRHFESKEGLLKAILDEGSEKANLLVAHIMLSSDPKEIIRKTLELPFRIEKAHYEHWRLIYALKWQTSQYDSNMTDALKLVLTDAFKKLGYKKPASEAELVLLYIDGAATTLLLHEPKNKKDLLNALLQKYQI